MVNSNNHYNQKQDFDQRFKDLQLKSKEHKVDNVVEKNIGKDMDPVALETAKLNIAEGRRNGFMCWM